ncbi:MAG: hypothetical protein HC897_17855 [Thermoanaerobaculia bacterium]|nr:hypothetical protein [Thermoanaerobaculia bacterium]
MKLRIVVAGWLTLLMAGHAGAQENSVELVSAPLAAPTVPTAPPLPPLDQFPIQLVLDDDVAESTTGVLGPGGGKQFLWFNRFASPGQFRLEQIWVLFPPGANITVGAPVQLVVYHDPDGDPTTGADLLATLNETIQVLDGATFSVYDLAPTVDVPAGGDVLIGVVDRFVVSGVTPLTQAAAIDTSATQQRSWLATWIGDPPAAPTLPSDGALVLLDDLLPTVAGNWMIRGFGSQPPNLDVPVLSSAGLIALALLLAAGGLVGLRRIRGA